MKKVFFFFLVLYLKTISGQAQDVNKHLFSNDSFRIIKALDYLKEKIGTRYTDSLSFSGTFHSILYIVTFDINSKVNKNYKNTIPVFFDGLKVDTVYNTKIDSIDLINFFANKPTKHIIVNKSRAIYLAKKSSLPQGIRQWEIELINSADKLSWQIRSFETDDSGKVLEINAWSEEQSQLFWIRNY